MPEGQDTEGCAVIDHDYEPGRFGDDGICHARVYNDNRDRCYRPKSEHKETTVTTYRIKDMPEGTVFTANGSGGASRSVHRFRVTGAEQVGTGEFVLSCETHDTGATAGYVDESTIRNVVYPRAQDAVDEQALTVADLLNEPCEDFTGDATCADKGSGRVPVSRDGTYRQYCGPCRLRYAFQKDVVEPVEAAEKPKQRYYLYVMYTDGSFQGSKCTDIDQDTDEGFLTVFGLSEDKTRTINLRHVQFYDVRPLQEDS